MSYHISKIVQGGFQETHEKVVTHLKDVGFGVITQIDMEDGRIKVSAIDAQKMMSVVGSPELEKISGTVNERLSQALDNL